jgi:FixJ family two-component response regulator
MPGLGGDALAARARLLHSELPVLLMTASADIATASEVPWAAVIRKPFRIAALLDALDCSVMAPLATNRTPDWTNPRRSTRDWDCNRTTPRRA